MGWSHDTPAPAPYVLPIALITLSWDTSLAQTFQQIPFGKLDAASPLQLDVTQNGWVSLPAGHRYLLRAWLSCTGSGSAQWQFYDAGKGNTFGQIGQPGQPIAEWLYDLREADNPASVKLVTVQASGALSAVGPGSCMEVIRLD